MTDVELAAWLRDDKAQRVTLYECGVLSNGSETTRYLSNRAYGLGDPATPYAAIIARDLKRVEAISREGGARLSAGKIGIHNLDGQRDAWLDDVWVNRPIRVYVGDVRWPRAEFRLDFAGIIKDISGADDPNVLTLELRDITQRINAPVSEKLLPDGSLWPVTIGEVPNLTPKLRNAATGERVYHTGPVEGVIEPRVEGKKRAFTENKAEGAFTLTSAVGPGALTCSVQGDKTGGIYRNTIAACVRLLVTSYGKASDRFTDAEIDIANFDAFDLAHPQVVGLYMAERTNVIEACHQFTGSVRAYLVPSRVGQLRLVKYGIPAVATASLTPSDYVVRTLRPLERIPARAAAKIGYCRNYTVQANLQTSLPDEHKALFAAQWRTVTAVDTGTRDRYKLTTEPVQEDTCFVNQDHAVAEVARWIEQDKTPRQPFALQGEPITMLLNLAQGVTLYGPRYQLAAGKLAQITLISFDYGTYKSDIEVTV